MAGQVQIRILQKAQAITVTVQEYELNFINHPLVGTPYGVALDLCIVLAIVCWVLSILTREYSWTDRLWSIVPAVYCLIVAVDLEFQSARVNIMTVLATL